MKHTVMMTVEAPEDAPVEDMIEHFLLGQGISVVEPDEGAP
jgi:hypothetical protein